MIRTTLVIPEALHKVLRRRAAHTGTSMRALIIQALEDRYGKNRKAAYVTDPLIKRRPGAKVGPLFPKDENPHDLVFS